MIEMWVSLSVVLYVGFQICHSAAGKTSETHLDKGRLTISSQAVRIKMLGWGKLSHVLNLDVCILVTFPFLLYMYSLENPSMC